MSNYPRYAIYFLPPPQSPLARFGAAMLGYDVYSGEDVPFDETIVSALSDWREISRDPRGYGFHATLKAPIALGPQANEAELLWACAAFAETPRRVPRIKPAVRDIGSFIALMPAQPSEALQALAADCVRDFDSFRAPLTDADRARRKPERLSELQRDYLERFGYPYVLDEFRFHMTLTGSLEPTRQNEVLPLLQGAFAATGLTEIAIDHIAVLRQDAAGARFKCLAQFELRDLGA